MDKVFRNPIVCPGCGAEIDLVKMQAEFRVPPVTEEPPAEVSPAATRPAAIPRAGNAFFKPRKKE